MPFADTAWPTWLAASAITVLLWWTIVSPLAILGVAVLGARRPRTGYALTIAVCAPPLLVLLPLTVMRGGAGAVAAGAAAALEIVAVCLSLAALVAYRRPAPSPPEPAASAASGEAPRADAPQPRGATLGLVGVFCAVAGGMVGSLAFLTLFT